MFTTGRWIRNQIASYGAAVAIIIEQLNANPGATITENPNPLVRIQSRGSGEHEWDPDELVTRSCGRQYVLVWENRERAFDPVTIQAN